MNRPIRLVASSLAVALLLAPVLLTPVDALARAGGGASMGSRGTMTYSAPPSTQTAPYGGQQFNRSMTPQAPQGLPNSAPYGSPGRAPGLFGGGFGAGLLGGLLGAGIGGMLFGHGFFGGISGFGGLFGFIIQILILAWVVRWLMRRFMGGTPSLAGIGPMAREMNPGTTGRAMGGGLGGMMGGMMDGGAAPAGPGPVAITPADYQAFEQSLQAVQAAWSSHDLTALRALSTPEMASYFAEQLADQVSRGVRNIVSDVRLNRGDLAQSWAEPGRDYATVAMQFSMIDVTQDVTGRIVDGSPSEHVTATEIWTFVRSPGGRWILSAIQQAAR